MSPLASSDHFWSYSDLAGRSCCFTAHSTPADSPRFNVAVAVPPSTPKQQTPPRLPQQRNFAAGQQSLEWIQALPTENSAVTPRERAQHDLPSHTISSPARLQDLTASPRNTLATRRALCGHVRATRAKEASSLCRAAFLTCSASALLMTIASTNPFQIFLRPLLELKGEDTLNNWKSSIRDHLE